MVCVTGFLSAYSAWPAQPESDAGGASGSLWAHDNLVAWEVSSYNDAKKRGPEDRARMLEGLGIKHYAHLQMPQDWEDFHANVDGEIEAMQRHGIDIVAWYFWVDGATPAQDSKVTTVLESFKRHRIHPRIWVSQSFDYRPQTEQEWAKQGIPSDEELAKLSEACQERVFETYHRIDADLEHLPQTPREQKLRVEKEAKRIHALVKLVAPYGLSVQIYNHNGWLGLIDNELAVLDRLREFGVSNVGLVYNFFHARDLLHDDVAGFPTLWERIKSHVSEVNITGVRGELEFLYPSLGDNEEEMMRTIQRSGWHGRIGVFGGFYSEDEELTLKNLLRGIDWLAAELNQAGSGGSRPFALASDARQTACVTGHGS
jgi:sugar phosphate isomerase/epimerase